MAGGGSSSSPDTERKQVNGQEKRGKKEGRKTWRWAGRDKSGQKSEADRVRKS